MPDYQMPVVAEPPQSAERTAYLVASGDSRLAANQMGWPTQEELEAGLARAFGKVGWQVVRAHQHDPAKGHGFIDSQRMGLEVFANVPARAPLVVAEAVWQYSHHVLAGLRSHEGPILTVANFSGKWPGLVGLLGLNAGLTKMGKAYSTAWSVDFTDPWFLDAVEAWTKTGRIVHDLSHVRALPPLPPSAERDLGVALAVQLQREKALIGVFDEGCMGMYNAVFDDELLNQLGIFKERLSQSALYAEMLKTPDAEAAEVRRWLDQAGMTFKTGSDDATELTEEQLTQQLKMYIAAVRLADDFGLDAIGIQYQQGLKDLVPASDLAEGLFNNSSRPPVTSRGGTRVLREGVPVPHFNEVDEGCAVDAVITNRLWTAMNLDPATTLHDVRWGEQFDGQFVWVFEISGSVPPSHLAGGYAGAVSWRQNPMYFPAGGGTIKGVCKAGELVWSRIYIEDKRLHADIGRGRAVDLPGGETERRWQATNPEWPIMHAVLDGISRDQFMARHKANHIQVAYAPDGQTADRALTAKAAMLDALGMAVHLCGTALITGNVN
jgi:hypothetical protein